MTPIEFDDALKALAARKSLTQDIALTRLRERGASMIQAIKAMTILFNLGLGAAKEAAARHPAWQPVHAAAEPLHEALAQHAENADRTMPISPPARRGLRR
jgi:ribosomal protein L7/L12